MSRQVRIEVKEKYTQRELNELVCRARDLAQRSLDHHDVEVDDIPVRKQNGRLSQVDGGIDNGVWVQAWIFVRADLDG